MRREVAWQFPQHDLERRKHIAGFKDCKLLSWKFLKRSENLQRPDRRGRESDLAGNKAIRRENEVAGRARAPLFGEGLLGH